MPRLDNLIVSTDFDTLRDDVAGVTIVQITVPGSVSVAAHTANVYSQTINFGSAESLLNTRVQSSKNGAQYYDIASNLSGQFVRTGSLGTYNLFINFSHTLANSVDVTVYLPNPYGSTMTSEAGSEVFTFRIRAYQQPRFS